MKKIKKFLESKELNTWGFKYYDTIKKAKIKNIEDIKYILSKCGNAIQCFDKKLRNNKELALIAVKQNGHAIHFLDENAQKDMDIINHAIKRGRNDTGYKGVKLKFILPDVSYWHLKFNNKKFKKETIGKVVNLKLNDTFNENRISFYTGETINGVPNGHGISETYDINKMNKTVYKKVGKEWANNYQKKFSVKKIGYNLESKYIGEWKFGLWNGKGILVEYYGPEYFINKDGSPKISGMFQGIFLNGKKEGKFRESGAEGDKNIWKKTFYKKGFLID
jgi:hypothetical protein